MSGIVRTAPGNLARGLLMGGADIIPGVSGGTMALIVGIYERLIDAIRGVAEGVLGLVRGDVRGATARLRAVDWALLVPLGVGILLALAVGAVVLEPLIERYPTWTSATFAGLIIGALPIPWRRVGDRSATVTAVALAAGAAAFVFAGLTPGSAVDPSLVRVGLSAMVAICAMILPGVSGAYLLLVLGMYEPTLAAARALDVAYVGTFVLGCAVGLGAFSRLLSWLLDAHEPVTMAALVGLMAGSLRRLWPWQTDLGTALAPPNATQALAAVLVVCAAATLVVAIERLGSGRSDAAARPAGAER